MRRIVTRGTLAMVVIVMGLLAVAPAEASFFDFATDPDISNAWTHWAVYGADGPAACAWNSAGYLDATKPESADDNKRGYRPLGATPWNGTDTVTLTVNDYSTYTATYDWNYLLVGVSSSPNPAPANAETYVFGLESEGTALNYTMRTNTDARQFAAVSGAWPTTMKFDIVRDGTGYSFRVNDAEVFHDSANVGVSMPYYFIEFGGSGPGTASARLDDFGTVVPEPCASVLLLGSLTGLLAYAWRKRK
jgi:hypothetical protein